MKMLIKVQIGPVQEFIAQARSTRDMWAGSYLLAWMTAASMKVFKEAECEFIFPTLEDQPFYEMFNGKASVEGLIPTLPNVFMILMDEDKVETLSEKAEAALRAELKSIGEACWGKMIALGALTDWKPRWDDQLEAFPIFNWCAIPVSNDWKTDVENLGTQMAARRNTREFEPWNGVAGATKDILSGKEESIGSETFWKNEVWKKAGPYGAMNCIKRLFPSEVLEKKFQNQKAFWETMSMENTRDISLQNAEKNNPYIAVLAMDGDKMGAALKELNTQEEHAAFSQALARFAEQEVSSIVNAHGGQLVYAGGDDVLTMCPADQALDLAEALAEQFRETMSEYKLDSCCGIAVGHYQFPLQRIVEEARKAETRAKNKRGRAAFSLTLLKRSGEIIHWGAKWESKVLELYNLYTKMASHEDSSSRLPYALAELLRPYRLANLGKGDSCDRPITTKQLENILLKEYAHVRSRQKLSGTKEDQKKVDRLTEAYLTELTPETLEDFPNLFLASAFMNRQRGES